MANYLNSLKLCYHASHVALLTNINMKICLQFDECKHAR